MGIRCRWDAGSALKGAPLASLDQWTAEPTAALRKVYHPEAEVTGSDPGTSTAFPEPLLTALEKGAL